MNMDRNQLKSDLVRDEGLRLKVYKDSLGYLTIGVGRNIDARGKGISEREAMFLLDNDIDDVEGSLQDGIKWYTGLSEARQRALCNMAFNLGVSGLMKFQNMLGAMSNGNWPEAHAEALSSTWANQVGARAQRIADLIVKG